MQEPAHIGEIIPDSLKSLGDEFYHKYLCNSVIFNWTNIVGKSNAAKIKPLRISYKNLFVSCSDSSWKSAMYAYKSEFIRKINEYAKKDLVEDIIFTNVPQKPKFTTNSRGVDVPLPQQVNLKQEIRKIVLTEVELEEIRKSCECIEVEELREAAFKASVSQMRLDKYRRKNGWHDCPICGLICPPEDKICDRCKSKNYEMFEKAVIKLLDEIPGLTYAEIKNEIEKMMPNLIEECTPEAISGIRSDMVQRLCRSINLGDKNQISNLVMLFKCVRAEHLSEKLINNALFELRYDLPLKGRWKFER